mmetsp:Transcript_21944/g.52451  ORF Transcript_21944/g.52451 Transcript_21944/m.52451 type:complete len:210 (-) Transcript_21944:147-776(-)
MLGRGEGVIAERLRAGEEIAASGRLLRHGTAAEKVIAAKGCRLHGGHGVLHGSHPLQRHLPVLGRSELVNLVALEPFALGVVTHLVPEVALQRKAERLEVPRQSRIGSVPAGKPDVAAALDRGRARAVEAKGAVPATSGRKLPTGNHDSARGTFTEGGRRRWSNQYTAVGAVGHFHVARVVKQRNSATLKPTEGERRPVELSRKFGARF